MINGEAVSGVTTMQMDEGLDTGDMLLKTEVPLEPEETGGSLHDKLAAAGASLCVRTLKALEEGTVTPKKQGESPTAYASMLKKEMGEIRWEESAISIERLIRGLNPWPSAYTGWQDKTMKIWEAEVLEEDSGQEPGPMVQGGQRRIPGADRKRASESDGSADPGQEADGGGRVPARVLHGAGRETGDKKFLKMYENNLFSLVFLYNTRKSS